jgi:hypothetical protein
MARDLSTDMANAITAQTVAPVSIFYADFPSGAVRVWSGYGDLSFASETWLGIGDFGGVERIEETTDLRANGCRFVLSGIPSQYIVTALSEDYQGRACTLYLGAINITTGALISTPYILFSGRMDVISIDEGAEEAKIFLEAENRLIDLYRARERRYTHEDQLTAFPGDLGLEYVAGLQDKAINWGVISTTGAAQPTSGASGMELNPSSTFF